MLILGAKNRCRTEQPAGHSHPTPGARGPTGWTALGLAGAAGTGASPPRGGLGPSGRERGRPTRAGLSSLSVEQKLSGSHKALVETQDVVAELLKTVSWEYPATKVRGWGPAVEPTSSLVTLRGRRVQPLLRLLPGGLCGGSGPPLLPSLPSCPQGLG